MKKLLCLLVCLATLATLCGCNDAHSTFEGFPRPFEASVEGEWNGVTFSAEVKAGHSRSSHPTYQDDRDEKSKIFP